MRQPDFDQLLKVLARELPDRPTLFEFFLNGRLYEHYCGYKMTHENQAQCLADAFAAAGYDYCTLTAYGIDFPRGDFNRAKTISLNEGSVISSWEDFERYPWPDAAAADYSALAKIRLRSGMKIVAHGPCGVLENLIRLVGYDHLCFLLADDPQLVQAVSDRIGAALLQHYERCLEYPRVGACISNDDWGFQQQPMLSPEDMRRYIIPWHIKIVELIHAAGRPAILHCCGNVYSSGLIDDIIDRCHFDARHSFEDKILPVEEAYEIYHQRIATLGGMDLDFLCRSSPAQIRQRSLAMLERAATRGGYALGSGNSIPDYVPMENYFAMVAAVTG